MSRRYLEVGHPQKSKLLKPEELAPFHLLVAASALRRAITEELRRISAAWPERSRSAIPNILLDVADALTVDLARPPANSNREEQP